MSTIQLESEIRDAFNKSGFQNKHPQFLHVWSAAWQAALASQVSDKKTIAEFEGYEDGGRPLFRVLGPLKVGDKLYPPPMTHIKTWQEKYNEHIFKSTPAMTPALRFAMEEIAELRTALAAAQPSDDKLDVLAKEYIATLENEYCCAERELVRSDILAFIKFVTTRASCASGGKSQSLSKGQDARIEAASSTAKQGE